MEMATRLAAVMMIVSMPLMTTDTTTGAMCIADDDDVLDGCDNGVSETCA